MRWYAEWLDNERRLWAAVLAFGLAIVTRSSKPRRQLSPPLLHKLAKLILPALPCASLIAKSNVTVWALCSALFDFFALHPGF